MADALRIEGRNVPGLPPSDLQESAHLLRRVAVMIRDERVTAALLLEHANEYSEESYKRYQTTLDTVAGQYFSPEEATRMTLPHPLDNDDAQRKLAGTLHAISPFLQPGPIRLALGRVRAAELFKGRSV